MEVIPVTGAAGKLIDQLEALQPYPLSVSMLAKDYHGALMRFLRRRVPGGPGEPEDIAQEAYIRMLQYEGSCKIRSPYYLLLRVATNVIRDLHRANRTRKTSRHRSLDDLELACGAPGPEHAAILDEEIQRVAAAIDDLPPRCREVFLMHRYSSLSYAEVAALCSISVKMVEKHISLALAHCAKRLVD